MVEANPGQNNDIIPLGLPIDMPQMHKRHSSVDGGGRKHTFKVIHGHVSGKRAAMVNTEEEKERQRLEQEE